MWATSVWLAQLLSVDKRLIFTFVRTNKHCASLSAAREFHRRFRPRPRSEGERKQPTSVNSRVCLPAPPGRT